MKTLKSKQGWQNEKDPKIEIKLKMVDKKTT
jgi:hypothetical protein